jgi:hypothetical protein
MSKLSQYPHLKKALVLLFADNNMFESKDIDDWEVPERLTDAFQEADQCAAQISGKPLKHFVPEDQIDPELESPDEDALQVMVAGEETGRTMLIEALDANSIALDEILNSAFDGALSRQWERMYGEKQA